MYIYVAHQYGGKPENYEAAKKVTHDLQIADKENTYLCPLMAFSHIAYNEVGYDDEMELCFDLLCLCDKLLVVGNISEGVSREIELAERLHLEVEYLAE